MTTIIRGGPRRWLRDLPVARKLAMIMMLWVLAFVGFGALGKLSADVLTSVRAYVGGEGLWAKSQRDTVFYLVRYAQGHEEADYLRYREALRVNLGDRQAREALERPQLDRRVAHEGFLAGLNHPDDIADLIWMFRTFRGLSYIDRAIALWSEADLLIEELSGIGEDLRRRIGAGQLDDRQAKAAIAQIENLHHRIIPLADEFSRTLGEASRWVTRLLLVLMAGSGAVLLALGILLVSYLGHHINRQIDGLSRGALRVANDDFSADVEVGSTDELGTLAATFNAMQARLKHHREELNAGAERLRRASEEAQALALQAQTANHAKSQFMATMSHEIRTPMNGVLGMTELLLDTPLDPQQRRLARAVYRSGENLLKIINDVLDFSKIEAGKLALASADFSPRVLVADVLELMAPAARQRGLALRVVEAPDLPDRLRGDAQRLRQVVTNLVGNAVKFTERGEVVVELRRAEAIAPEGRASSPADPRVWLEFGVRDTGIGIEAEALPGLFTAFSQASSGLARDYGGTGLGLAISQRIVHLMGGSIEVQSRVGAGSRFSVRVSLAAVAQAPADPQDIAITTVPGLEVDDERHAEAAGRRPGSRVLLIEDNPVNQEVAEQMLRKLGCRVQLASSAQAGLRALCQNRFDLVMMDIQMPQMDGTEALRRFRYNPLGQFTFVTPSTVPVVAVTASALEGDRERFLALGFDNYLSKPFRQNELHAMLSKHLMSSADLPGPAERGDAQPLLPAGGLSAATPASKAPPGQLDHQALQRLRELDPGGANRLLERVADAFETSTQRLLPQLIAAQAAGDLVGVKHVAHTLKSSSASIGALSLSALCADIEGMIRNQEVGGLAVRVAEVRIEILAVGTSLRALLDGVDSARAG